MQNRLGRAALIAVAVFGAAWSAPSVAAAQDAYTLDESWPRYPSDMVFEMGTGVAVGADGISMTGFGRRPALIHWSGWVRPVGGIGSDIMRG